MRLNYGNKALSARYLLPLPALLIIALIVLLVYSEYGKSNIMQYHSNTTQTNTTEDYVYAPRFLKVLVDYLRTIARKCEVLTPQNPNPLLPTNDSHRQIVTGLLEHRIVTIGNVVEINGYLYWYAPFPSNIVLGPYRVESKYLTNVTTTGAGILVHVKVYKNKTLVGEFNYSSSLSHYMSSPCCLSLRVDEFYLSDGDKLIIIEMSIYGHGIDWLLLIPRD